MSTSEWGTTSARRSRNGRSRPRRTRGYLGAPYFKITIAGTERALAATADAELVAVPRFTGAPEQLWRIEQLSDGAGRIMPKSMPLVLSAVGNSFATLSKSDPKSDKQRWQLKTPQRGSE